MAKRKNLIKYEREFIDLYDFGWSTKKIAKEYSISPTSVKNHLKKTKKLRSNRIDWDKYSLKMHHAYLSGMTFLEISKVYGISTKAVSLHLQKVYGDEPIPRKNTSKQYAKEWKKLYESGMSTGEIGKKYNFNQETVRFNISVENTRIRNFIESSYSKVNVDLKYFEKLDSVKKKQIDLMLSKIVVINNTSSPETILRFNFPDRKEAEFVFAGWTDPMPNPQKSYDKKSVYEIKSTKLYQKLIAIKNNNFNEKNGEDVG